MSLWSDFIAWLKPPAIKPVTLVNNKPEPSNTLDQNLSTIPQCGVELIKSFEKCELVGYAGQEGKATDGWGNTFGAKIGVPITQAQADADLLRNLGWASLAVKKAVKVPLTQNQFGALISFAYNMGETRFDKEAAALLFMLNSGNYSGIPNKLKQFVWVTLPNKTRIISSGLVRRRAAESALWQGSDWRQS